MSVKQIFWDWNGTLLNDVETCVEAMNVMLQKRNKDSLDIDSYKNIFTFPVQDYYRILGFDFEKESFENLSVEYINLYKKLSEFAPLQIGVVEALKYFQNEGFKQIILSASEQKSLEYQVEKHGIGKYFESILGLDNIYAKSKLQNGLKYMNESNIDKDKALFIGDTYHDYEVAREIGVNCILVENGHQNLSLFNIEKEASIIKDLKEICNSEIIEKGKTEIKCN